MPTSFTYIACRLFTFPLLLSHKLQKHYCYFYCRYFHYHITVLLNYLAADTKFPGVAELTTQLLILKSILWLPLCRINKFGFNTLPSKTVAIPYTCGLSLAAPTVTGKGHRKIEPKAKHFSHCKKNQSSWLITHKCRGSQQFSRVKYSTQIC